MSADGDDGWTIDADRRRILYTGPDKPNYYDNPPWKGRIFAVTSGRAVDGNTFQSGIFPGALIYKASFWWWESGRWLWSTPAGLMDIPGGNIRMQEGIGSFRPSGDVKDLPTLGRILIEGADGLYLFDGARIERVRNGGSANVGSLLDVFDLRSIGRVLVGTEIGVYEITHEGELVARPMPFPTGLVDKPKFADWPVAKVALVKTMAGIFSVTQDMIAKPVLGSDLVDFSSTGFVIGEIDGTGDLILSITDGVFLAVDSTSAGPEPCDNARRSRESIADSDLCLRSIPGTDEMSIGSGFHVIEAPRDQGLLISSSKGMFLQRPEGSIVTLQSRSGQYVGQFVRVPWADDLVAIGWGLEVVHSDLSIESFYRRFYVADVRPSLHAVLLRTDGTNEPYYSLTWKDGNYRLEPTTLKAADHRELEEWWDATLIKMGEGIFLRYRDGGVAQFDSVFREVPSPDPTALNRVLSEKLRDQPGIFVHGEADYYGRVFDVADVGFAGFAMIRTSAGTYTYQARRLMRVPELTLALGGARPIVLPRLRRVVLEKHFVTGPRLFDLARRSPQGECDAPLVKAQ